MGTVEGVDGRGRRSRAGNGFLMTQAGGNRGRDLSWEPLRVERVCEVAYDHLQGDRFRHATTFRRWRPDRTPADCRYDQLQATPAFELDQVLGRGGGGGGVMGCKTP